MQELDAATIVTVDVSMQSSTGTDVRQARKDLEL
jgi:hypothetical protein